MSLFPLPLENGTIFGMRTTRVDTLAFAIKPAITFEPDQTTVTQLVTGLQEIGSAVSPVGNHNHLTVPKERLERSQLFDGYLDRSLFRWDTPNVERGNPTTWSLGQKDHLGGLPANTDRFVYQRQVWHVDVATILTRFRIETFDGGCIYGYPSWSLFGWRGK